MKMKTIIKKSAIVALMLGTLNSYATGTTLVEKNVTEGKVELVNVRKGQHLYIKNSEGKILYKTRIEKNGDFTQNFDFTSFKNGYYTLEVNKDFQIEVTPFTIISGKATFYKKEEKVIFKPVIRTEAEKVMISKLDFDSNPLKIAIYYQGEVIYKDTVKGEDVLERIYKLEKDKKGAYKVILKTNDRTYTNEFSL